MVLVDANCKKCGSPTCMAFALKLAQKKVEIEACPFAPQELIDIFSEYSKIQQNTVIYGKNVQIGGETVMLRHERTFINKTSFVIKLLSNDKEFDKKLEKISSWQLERVAEIFKIDGIYLEDNGGDIDKCVEKMVYRACLCNEAVLCLSQQRGRAGYGLRLYVFKVLAICRVHGVLCEGQ